jgi:hypothetical protein
LQLPPPPNYQNTSSQPRQMTAGVQRLVVQGLRMQLTVAIEAGKDAGGSKGDDVASRR